MKFWWYRAFFLFKSLNIKSGLGTSITLEIKPRSFRLVTNTAKKTTADFPKSHFIQPWNKYNSEAQHKNNSVKWWVTLNKNLTHPGIVLKKFTLFLSLQPAAPTQVKDHLPCCRTQAYFCTFRLSHLGFIAIYNMLQISSMLLNKLCICRR